MTLPFERTLAVTETHRFLRNLIDPKVTPGLPKAIRERARMLLRHYPTSHDLTMTVKGYNDKLFSFTFECPFDTPPDHDKQF